MLLAAAAAALFAVRGRNQWFFQDEWRFLATRSAGSLDDLLNEHNGHWTTLPLVVYRSLWNLFGLNSYLPYQAVTITLHLVTAALLRTLMRRMGVRPWMATLGAAVFLFFGAGSENVVWAFQMAFLGSIALGLGALLLADAPTLSTRRRVASLACGLGSLMCSGIGPVMVGTVGVALLLRRGWRSAAATVAPLAVVYAAWTLAYVESTPRREGAGPATVPEFITAGLEHALTSLGQSVLIGGLLVAVLVAGATVTGLEARHRLREAVALPVALLAGLVMFFVLTGMSRPPSFATRSRYAYLVVALLLPVIVFAADVLIRRWRLASIPVAILLVIGVPGNIAAIEGRQDPEITRALVLAMADSPAIDTVDADLQPFPSNIGARLIDAGWLRNGRRSGQIPGPTAVSPTVRAEVASVLELRVVDAPAGGFDRCRPLTVPVSVEVGTQETVGFRGAAVVRVHDDEGGRSRPREVGSFVPVALAAFDRPLTVEIGPRAGASPDLCT